MTNTHVKKLTPGQEYLKRQAEQMEKSPALLKKFPKLKSLKVNLVYFDPAKSTQIGEVKYSVNVANAKCMFVFACRNTECACGDFDLTAALASALRSRTKKVEGEVRCAGTRTRAKGDVMPCGNLLRYTLTMGYS
jgi:hypothetical protein